MEESTLSNNVETVRGFYESFAEGDIDAVVDTWAPDIELVETEGLIGSGTFIGPDQILENVFGPIAEEWEDVSVAPERFVDGGDTVVSLLTWSGTNVNTGRSTACRVAHVFDFTDGKIVRWESITDSALYNAAVEG